MIIHNPMFSGSGMYPESQLVQAPVSFSASAQFGGFVLQNLFCSLQCLGSQIISISHSPY